MTDFTAELQELAQRAKKLSDAEVENALRPNPELTGDWEQLDDDRASYIWELAQAVEEGRVQVGAFALTYENIVASEEYQDAVRAVSGIIAAWDNGGHLSLAVNDARLILDLDTESSASRQHFIDTGRYLPNGEAE